MTIIYKYIRSPMSAYDMDHWMTRTEYSTLLACSVRWADSHHIIAALGLSGAEVGETPARVGWTANLTIEICNVRSRNRLGARLAALGDHAILKSSRVLRGT